MTDISYSERSSRAGALAKLCIYSLIGIFVFFVPVTIAGKSTIPLDHAATAISTYARPAAIAFVCLLILYGALAPVLRPLRQSPGYCLWIRVFWERSRSKLSWGQDPHVIGPRS